MFDSMEIRKANLSDLVYILHLGRIESESIGFIPIAAYERNIDGRRGGSVLVCLGNSQHVGFVYATHNNSGVTHIQQIAIQPDARREERATALVEAVQRDNDWLISLRCAADLEATGFWEALGFALIGHEPPKSAYGRGRGKSTQPTRRKRDILRFQKVVGGLFLPERPCDGRYCDV